MGTMKEHEQTLPPRSVAAIPAIGVGGVVFNDQGRILLVRLRSPPQAGLWHIPGGRLEPGETLADCCRREVQEETGIQVIPGPILAIADRRVEGFHYVIIDFLTRLAPDSPLNPEPATDAAEACWIDPLEIHVLDLVEGLEPVIHAALATRDHRSGLSPEPTLGWLYVPEINAV
ncbi:MAG: NUDIX hydrolase [Methylococcus sp.]